MMVRVIAIALGLFGALNALVGLARPEWDANIWWIDLRVLPELLARMVVICAAGLWVAWACWPNMGYTRKNLTAAATGLALFACGFNAVVFLKLWASGAVRSSLPIPVSLGIAIALLLILIEVMKPVAETRAGSWFRILAATSALAICALGFPLAQIFLFGKTDYRRRADAAVVFGARVYDDGSLSLALADRVRTACELYREGWVKTLIFSGGPGDGAVHETEAMRAYALTKGVPEDAIVLDKTGVNTRASLEFARAWMKENNAKRVLGVSHFYHLPRIKLDSQRMGIEVVTVPAKESRTLVKMPWLVAREVAALWKYYLIPPV